MLDRRPSCLLPDNAEPIKYKVHLTPLPNFRFRGSIEVSLLIRKPTREIVMHADDLTDFRAIKISSSEGVWTKEPISAPRLDSTAQTLTLDFGKVIPFGATILRMDFSGTINDKLCGLYQSAYQSPGGAKRYLATTQCEAIDCRKIFPCFDEPRWKAIFELMVDIPESLAAVSNMPVAKVETLPYGFKRVFFEPTPPMSSYLFALLIGELDESRWLTARTKDGVLVRVITIPGKENLGKHALRRAVKTLEFYTRYYKYGYPLPKCDLAAIPDFGSGAMENWGLDMFRESALLVDPKHTSGAQLERIDLDIDHELGHQLHGDMITMFWWNDLSLNEAFATWTGLLVSRNLDPKKGAEEKFTAEYWAEALKDDGLKTTRPVHVWIDHPDEIGEAFDIITYAKGGSVLRMLEHFVSPKKFRNAMRRYIPRHEYGVITQKDLWRAVGEECGLDVVALMDPWWNKPGYPVLTVEKSASDGYKVSQSRFFYDGGWTETEAEADWQIPMLIRTGDRRKETRPYLLTERSANFTELPQDTWIVWNAGATGFYRVSYDAADLARISDALKAGEIINTCERIALFNDVSALTKTGRYYSIETFFDFYRALRGEKHLRVWQRSLAELSSITSLFAHENYASWVDAFIREVVEERALELGWEIRPREDHQTKILRGLLLSACGTNGHEGSIAEARERFARALKNLKTLDPDLRAAVYKIVGANGDENDYENLLSLYRRVELQEEKGRVFLGLASFRRPELIKRTLELLLTDEVRSQDVYVYLRPLGANPHASKMTWQFAKDRWSAFCDMYDKGKLLGLVILSVTSHLASLEDEADVRAFFEANPVPEAKRTIAQMLETIRIRAKCHEQSREALAQYFSAQSNRATLTLTTEALVADTKAQRHFKLR